VSRDAGDSFEEFVRGRSAYLFQLALLLTGQKQEDAEDLLQVALERAWRRRGLRYRHGSPEPYVRQILVNASIDRWRRLRVHWRHTTQRDQRHDSPESKPAEQRQEAHAGKFVEAAAGADCRHCGAA